jgi:uncharacterized protein
MQYTEGKPGRVFIVRVDHGEDLIATLLQFVRDHQVHSGYIRFMGALESGQVVTGPEVLTLPPDPHFESFSGGWEVIGMATITSDKNGPHLHIHASIGRGNKVLTGCLRGEIITYIVVEAVVTELIGVDVQREQDPVTGLQLPVLKHERSIEMKTNTFQQK